MEIPVKFAARVNCLAPEPDTLEHLIPASIGGQAEARMLCKPCNDRFGHQLDHELKRDPQIRFAVEHLRECLPNLHRRYNEGLDYTAQGSSGQPLRLRMKGGQLRIREARLDDGSIVSGMSSTLQFIEKELRRQGKADEVDQMQKRFLDSPYDELMPIGERAAVAKRSAQGIDLKLTPTLASDRLKLKIGYLHLAFLMSTSIHDLIEEYPGYFAPILHAINGHAEIPEHVEILSGMTREFQPCAHHIVRYVADSQSLAVEAQLFGVLKYRVTFLRLTPGPVDLPLLLHDLRDRQVLIAKTYAGFKKGEYWALGQDSSE